MATQKQKSTNSPSKQKTAFRSRSLVFSLSLSLGALFHLTRLLLIFEFNSTSKVERKSWTREKPEILARVKKYYRSRYQKASNRAI